MHFEKLQILKDILGDCIQSKDEYLFFCPFCKHHKKKMSINITKNSYKCWVCDTRSRDIYSLIKRAGDNFHKQKWLNLTNVVEVTKFEELFKTTKVEVKVQKIDLPPEYKFLADKDMPQSAATALEYLFDDRDIEQSDIYKWKIGYCDKGKYRNRIIIPSFDKDGYCNYFIARSYTGDWMSYKNPPVSKNIIFNELMLDWDEPIVLVEGVFDAIKADNAIPLLGSTLNKQSILFNKLLQVKPTVYLALDNDAEKKSLTLIKNMILYGLDVYKIDTSGYEDIGAMPKKEYVQRRKQAELIDSDSFLLLNVGIA